MDLQALGILSLAPLLAWSLVLAIFLIVPNSESRLEGEGVIEYLLRNYAVTTKLCLAGVPFSIPAVLWGPGNWSELGVIAILAFILLVLGVRIDDHLEDKLMAKLRSERSAIKPC